MRSVAPVTCLSQVAWAEVGSASVLVGLASTDNAAAGGELVAFKRAEEGNEAVIAGRVLLGGEGRAVEALGNSAVAVGVSGAIEVVTLDLDVSNSTAAESTSAPRSRIGIATLGAQSAAVTSLTPTLGQPGTLFFGTEAGSVGTVDITRPDTPLAVRSTPELCQLQVISLQALAPSVTAGITQDGVFLYDARARSLAVGPLESPKVSDLTCMAQYADSVLFAGGRSKDGGVIAAYDTRMHGVGWAAELLSATPTGSRLAPTALAKMQSSLLLVGNSAPSQAVACAVVNDAAASFKFAPLPQDMQPSIALSAPVASIATDGASIGVGTLGAGAYIASLPGQSGTPFAA